MTLLGAQASCLHWGRRCLLDPFPLSIVQTAQAGKMPALPGCLCYGLAVIVAMAGLPGSGKSTIARGLAQLLPGLVVNKDEIRVQLFSIDEIDYSSEQDAVCFEEMLRLTEDVLTRSPGKWVILDGRTFSRAADLDRVADLARRLGEVLFVIHCVCSDKAARRRIEADVQAGRHPAANRDYDLYLKVKARQEPLPFPALRLNTDLDESTCLSLCLSYLSRPPDPRPSH